MLENMGKSGGPRIVVCCGSGGVGKTTISAAIGLHGALSGLKTIVLTIDPARRLADVLGIGAFRDKARRVPLDSFGEMSGEMSGELHAMMLDAKRTFDHLVERYAPKEMQQRILANRYYQHLSENMGGSHEYMAMEKLYEIHSQGGWDLIVLDTPPSRRALDFLDAPQRVLNLLGHPYFMKLLRPRSRVGKLGGRVFGLVMTPFMKAVSQVVGKQAMEDLVSFFSLFNDALLDGFENRAKAVESLLSGPTTAFVAITTPRAYPMQEAGFFYRRLKERGMPFYGFVVNRVHQAVNSADVGTLFREIRGKNLLSPESIRDLETSYHWYSNLAQSDQTVIRQLVRATGATVPVAVISMEDGEVCDMAGLRRIGRGIVEGENRLSEKRGA
ncbi:MAG: ArsA-related P-loop ATPase [Desulfosalsimonadaceae bacterium]